MYSDLLSQVATTDERELLLGELECLRAAQFDIKAGGLEGVLKSQLRKKIAEKIREELPRAKSVDDYIDGLEKELTALKAIKLSLAVEPSESLEEAIFSWVSKNSKSRLLIDIEIDGSILGGAIVAHEGKYYDGTVLKLVQESFAPPK